MGTGVGEMIALTLFTEAVKQTMATTVKGVKAPELPAVIEQPDPLAQNETQKRKIVEQMARSGRASTIMTENTGTLGG
jgi:hypothetical protein